MVTFYLYVAILGCDNEASCGASVAPETPEGKNKSADTAACGRLRLGDFFTGQVGDGSELAGATSLKIWTPNPEDGLGLQELPSQKQTRSTWSPRRRQSPRRRKEPETAEKGAHKGKGGKGQHKGAGQGKTEQTAGAPALKDLPTPPTAALPAVPTATNQAGNNEAPPAYSELLAALSSSREELPETVRSLVDVHLNTSHKAAAKSLHRLVALQSQAKQELSKVRRSRDAFLGEWYSYVESLGDLLEQQLATKTETMTAFAAAEEKWQQQMVQATRSLAAESKASGDEEAKGTVVDVDAEDAEMEVSAIAEADARKAEAKESAVQKEEALISVLRKVKDGAKEELDANARERTPRRKSKEAEAGSQSSSPPA